MRSITARASWVATALLATGLTASGCEVGEGPPPTPLPLPESVENPAVLSGGTLTLSRDGGRAVMSDTGLDQLHVFTLDHANQNQELTTSYAFEPGDEPGRVVEGEDNVMFVALRRAGAIARVNIDSGTMDRVEVCQSPRGMAYDQGLLHVACAGGELQTLDANLTLVRELRLAPDLRDVVVTRGKLVVSRFRAAELIVLDDNGAVQFQLTPYEFTSNFDGRTFRPAVAYQLQVLDNGEVAMVHQRSFVGEVPIPEEPPPDELSGSAYGGGGAFECDTGIVHAAITVFDVENGVIANNPNTGGVGTLVLPLDVAVSASGNVATVGAGNDRVVEMDLNTVMSFDAIDNCFPGEGGRDVQVLGEPVAVRYLPDGNLLVQTRQPAALRRIDLSQTQPDELGLRFVAQPVSVTELPGPSRRHAGHGLFHKAASPSSQIACASCHPEGQDDGLTWTFERIGARRTQNVAGGLLDTLPLHWDGEFEGMHNLVADVFVNRMGGKAMKDDRVEELQNWMHAIPRIPSSEALDTSAVGRGEALYHDAEVGCATCHGGDALTNNSTVDVGTGLALQVPSLRSIAYRAPYMHTGCAATLMDRFTAPCGGGDQHGKTSHLSEAQLRDLVAYLETL